MAAKLLATPAKDSKPVWLATAHEKFPAGMSEPAMQWATANGFDGKPGSFLTIPGADGAIAGALFGTGTSSPDELLGYGKLATALPEGNWHFANQPANPDLAALGFLLGSYRFAKYRVAPKSLLQLACPTGANPQSVTSVANAMTLARDLINTPANDMGPEAIETAVRSVAKPFKAKVKVTKGEALKRGFPMIHAVGRAAGQEPRLIDFSWGRLNAPRITLVGKGVAFDTGGLDIKPSSSMLLMKKDMGGAANVLALAQMIMDAKVKVRLRVLIPAVENSISAEAFRPGDVLTSRSGLTVEIGNTDAEGRLILADALHLAEQDDPDLLINMATLTGAARVALGPDLPPFFTNDDTFAKELAEASIRVADPLWRMPLWAPYDRKLASKVADMNNVTTDGFAGAVTAALFLQRFVPRVRSWAHFDIFAWVPSEKAHAPVGGEGQAIRAIFDVLQRRYG
ncbi:MAG: leucyl aminopeptidase family protein [Rhizobiaceae bacterium]